MGSETKKVLQERNRVLQERLDEAEETLQALRSGEVDALITSGPDGDQVYTLKGADAAYRVILENMAEGAVTVARDGLILFSNGQFASMLGIPLERVIGSSIRDFVAADDVLVFSALLSASAAADAEVRLKKGAAGLVPVLISANTLSFDGTECVCLIITDLTEQKRSQEIVSAERLARSILDQAVGALLVVDPSGRIIRTSRAAGQMAKASVLLRHFDHAFSLRTNSQTQDLTFAEIFATVQRLGGLAGLEAVVRVPDGQMLDVIVSAGLLTGANSECLGCIVMLSDVSALKRVEAALRTSEQRLAGIICSAMDPVISVDERGLITLFNPAAERVFGCAAAAAVGQSLERFIPQRFRGAHIGHVRKFGESTTVHKPMSERGEITALRIDEREFPMEASISRTQVGEEKEFTVILRDISERKQAEEELRDSETILRSFFDSPGMMRGMVELVDGRILHLSCNEAAAQLYGVDRKSISGRAVPITPNPAAEPGAWDEVVQELVDFYQKAQSTGKPVSREYARLDAQGRQRWLHATGSYIGIGRSGHPRFAYTMLDVTDRRRAEEVLKQKAEELARSNADLEQFAYIASHDLKEPLRAVSGCVKLLERRCEGKLDDRAAEYMTHAIDGTVRMGSLIDGLLAFSRVGTRGGKFGPVDCTTLLNTAHQNLAASIQESGAVITHDPLPTVLGDATQLESLLQNLIGNALKFRKATPPRIHVGARRKGSDWQFCIRDNGIGIDPQYFGRIFGIFQRLHTRSEYPGTGIGLAVCKKIVERHGGRIWVESVPGEGSIFYFNLLARIPGQSDRGSNVVPIAIPG